ncbi:uncharacterized protein CXorf58 homolog isoform X2 [Chrysemys picta bellii]|uniref:uncharacterized protein CXorf58 homolog isoform X2 n=1 Tax=Chrysemys picta bellii TaxID=8478 RepID=UPI0032B1EE86
MLLSGAARRAGSLSCPADEELAAKILQRAWWSHINRRLFRLLTHTIRAAEHCITYEIMRRVSPLEAELIKDPSMQYKVRFRFAGHEFPPFVVFKIFHHTGGRGSKYISGKRTISPASEAAADACKLMGHRKYYDQIIWDELQYQNHKIIDEIDVATVKDYMQYISNLDETPAYCGGRDNCWRKLSLENFPRTMIMYDIMDYAQSGTLSNRLKEKLTFLLLRPQNEELRHDQLMTVSRVRSYQPSSLPSPSVRRSRQARQKVAKMKRVHALEKEREEQKLDVTNRSHFTEHQETMTAPIEDLEEHSVFSDEEWEHEAAKLYAWSQALSLEDTGESSLTPNF